MLRLGFDVDGVLADFRTAFHALATTELGLKRQPDLEGNLSKADIERLWKAVSRVSNWWADLPAYESDQIARLYGLSRQWRWEVFFMTSRPPSGGDAVQIQTQAWLERHGFYLPSVLTAPALARGEIARALRLDLVVDDHFVNCMEIIGASNSKVLHMAREPVAEEVRQQAESRGIGVVSSFSETLDAIERLHHVIGPRQGRLLRLSDWFTSRREPEAPVLPHDPRRRRDDRA
jgi:hypothetical protein